MFPLGVRRVDPSNPKSIPYGNFHQGRRMTPSNWLFLSVVPTRSVDELGSTKVTDRSNYTLLSKAQHKDKDDDESVKKIKTDKPFTSNTTENTIETKLVQPEEESYKV